MHQISLSNTHKIRYSWFMVFSSCPAVRSAVCVMRFCTYTGCYMRMSKSQKQRFFVFFLRSVLAILKRSRQHEHQSGSAVPKQFPLRWVLPVLDFIRGCCVQNRNFKCGIWHIASLSERPGLLVFPLPPSHPLRVMWGPVEASQF